QGGQSNYSGVWGGYLPVIHALRDSIDMLNVQLYNSGTMYGIDRRIYTQGTADFIVAMTEAVIKGFQTNGGFFSGLPAHKVGVGLPACSNAAGGGYVAPATVKAAVDYLRGIGPKPGTYTLVQAGGYPDLRGMMTWSINWDRVSNCGGTYGFAQNYETIFGSGSGPTCPTPAAPSFTGITTGSATATWTAVSGATGYVFRYKPQTAATYTQVLVGTNSYTMTGLSAYTTYVADVQAICSGGSSGISATSAFTTLPLAGTCNSPMGLTVANIKFNSATASWTAASGATSYELQYKLKSSATWISRVQTGTSAALSSLTAGSTYEVRLRSICPGTVYSAYSAIVEFVTPARGGKKAADQLITANGETLLLELTPNPATDRLWLRSDLAAGRTIPYRITSMQGQVLQSGILTSPVTMLTVAALPPGMYLVQAGGGTRRFVKMR
ncbi:MAG TPA: fibronectin type III domain-containing protein, partial [Phnomibacter sp.]|nr:fibronectin type III domain-containing protein [Phnomibacter sp.]